MTAGTTLVTSINNKPDLGLKMRLKRLRVQNYKCIEDSQEFAIDQITCLVGKNEAGKTAVLEALEKLNSVDDDRGSFKELEYPRRHLVSQRVEKNVASENVLTTTWELEESDVLSLNKILGVDALRSGEVIVKKGYENVRSWSVDLDVNKFIEHTFSDAKLDATERARLGSTTSVRALIDKLSELDNPTLKHSRLLERLQELIPKDKSLYQVIYAHLADRMPRFVYFDVYHKLPGKIALTDLKRRKAKDKLQFEDKIFLALLHMTSSSLEEVEKIGESEHLIVELEAIGNRLTDQVVEYWSQNKHLEVDFRFDHARPNDPPPYDEGYIFSTRIRNTRHRATVNFNERSSGFTWFFSFLIWFSEVRRHYGENIFLLLDEPGLSLHGKAQQDLLRYMNDKLRPKYQVMYSAHSPFMIDIEHIFSLRTVEDVVSKHGGSEQILGTKVGQKILSRDEDTLFPLQGIVGFDIAQTMLVGPYVVVVEGPTEAPLMRWFSRQLDKRDRERLDLRWAICPAESASKVSSFVTLFRGRGLKIAALMDYHQGQKGMVDRLEESGLLEDGHLLRTTSFVENEEADIEDLLGRHVYFHLVNEAMQLEGEHALPVKPPEGASQRIVKEVEGHCRLLPPRYSEFRHFLPIEYLLGLSDEEVEQIPGIETALDRFEQLFREINNLA